VPYQNDLLQDGYDLGNTLLELLSPDGGTMSNQAALEALNQATGRQISQQDDDGSKERLAGIGLIHKGCGRGGTIALAEGSAKAGGNGAVRASKTNKAAEINGKCPEPTFQIGQQLTLSQLKSFLWKSADIRRGSIDATEFKNYFFGML
jgi:hypothetical protein